MFDGVSVPARLLVGDAIEHPLVGAGRRRDDDARTVGDRQRREVVGVQVQQTLHRRDACVVGRGLRSDCRVVGVTEHLEVGVVGVGGRELSGELRERRRFGRRPLVDGPVRELVGAEVRERGDAIHLKDNLLERKM